MNEDVWPADLHRWHFDAEYHAAVYLLFRWLSYASPLAKAARWVTP